MRSECLKEEHPDPSKQGHRAGGLLDVNTHPSQLYRWAQHKQRQLMGRIHLGSPASRSGGAKIPRCQGSQLPLLPKYKHLACRDIFLLSSRCLLGSFCSSHHSWGKMYPLTVWLLSKTQQLTPSVGWNVQPHAQVACLKHCSSSGWRCPRGVREHPGGTTKVKAL